jgi:hypothetical protein
LHAPERFICFFHTNRLHAELELYYLPTTQVDLSLIR